MKPIEHWTEKTGKLEICANCGAGRRGVFCPDCGQKHLEGRLNFREIVIELLSKLANWDRGLLHTFLGLLIRPGIIARDFLTGKQRPYVNPLAYFFIGATLQLLTLWIIESSLRDTLRTNFQPTLDQMDPATLAKIEERLETDFGSVIVDSYISSIQQSYSYAALFFFCFPFAIALKWMHQLKGERFRLGETMVFALYSVGQMLAITAFITPIAYRLGPVIQSFVGPVTYLIIAMRAHSGFFEPSWISRLITFLALFVSVLVFLTSILGFFALSIILRIVFAGG